MGACVGKERTAETPTPGNVRVELQGSERKDSNVRQGREMGFAPFSFTHIS
jgi:hypothetical protein